MSGTIIGRVVHIKGVVEVRDLQGLIKLLSLGDDVHAGELVQTGANAEIIIDFLNGKRLELAESSEALLDESVYRGQEFGNSEFFADLDAVQKALLDGTLDINDLPATAAGAEQDAIFSDGLADAVINRREGREGQVDVRLSPVSLDENAGVPLVDLRADVLEPTVPTGTGSSASLSAAPVTAVADARSIGEDAAVPALGANLLTNDVIASGSPLSVVAVNGVAGAVGTVVAGAFGTFTIAADGSYTSYVRSYNSMNY